MYLCKKNSLIRNKSEYFFGKNYERYQRKNNRKARLEHI